MMRLKRANMQTTMQFALQEGVLALRDRLPAQVEERNNKEAHLDAINSDEEPTINEVMRYGEEEDDGDDAAMTPWLIKPLQTSARPMLIQKI